MRRYCTAVAFCLASAGAAAAPPAQPRDMLDPRVLLGGLVEEAQVSALFDYLRNALIAAAEGGEGPVPEFLRRELDRIDAEVKLRGTLAGLLLLKELEAQVKALLKAPPSTGTPVPTPPQVRT